MSAERRAYRVAQWATGNIGRYALRMLIEHPQFELVGVWVHSPEKVGLDAGEICGFGRPTGVVATHDIEAILAARPDCVLHMPQVLDLDAVCRLLEAGINIVTTRFEFLNPATMDQAVRRRVEAACQAGGSSLHSTGATPGFITEAMPIVLASIERRLDQIIIEEFADLTSRNSPELLFQFMGFGQPPGAPIDQEEAAVRAGYRQSMQLIAQAFGMPLDSFSTTDEEAAARSRTEITAGVVEAGTVGAKRMTISGLRDGRAIVVVRSNWYLTRDVEADWELRESGWRLQVAGDAPLDLAITFPVAREDYANMSPAYSANRPVNAIAYVVEAAPGIRTTLDLPQVIARFG
jgi:4-hydroxy-tetrahydrodipicolinate reductase